MSPTNRSTNNNKRRYNKPFLSTVYLLKHFDISRWHAGGAIDADDAPAHAAGAGRKHAALPGGAPAPAAPPPPPAPPAAPPPAAAPPTTPPPAASPLCKIF